MRRIGEVADHRLRRGSTSAQARSGGRLKSKS